MDTKTITLNITQYDIKGEKILLVDRVWKKMRGILENSNQFKFKVK